MSELIDTSICVSCGNQHTPVFENSEAQNQWLDALGIKILGYYGGYFDRLEVEWDVPPIPFVYLCKICADILVEQNPWLTTLMNLPEG